MSQKEKKADEAAESKEPESKELSWDDIEGAQDLAGVKRVETPEWGGHVYVRKRSAYDWERWEIYRASLIKEGKPTLGQSGVRAQFAAEFMCSSTGRPIVAANKIAALARKSLAPLDRIYVAAHRFNGRPLENEDREKNSETDPADSSDTN